MIVKRKNDNTTIKHKQKQKQVKHSQKKTKKQSKMSGSASMRQLKNIHHPSKMIKTQNCHQMQNNSNYANVVMNNKFIQQVYHKIEQTQTVRQSREHRNIKMRKSASAGVLKSCRPVRRSLSPAGITKDIKTIDIRPKYSSKHTNRSDKDVSKQKLKSYIKKTEQQHKKSKQSKISKCHKTVRNQSQHLKTDISSKMPSIHKDFQKKQTSKKNSKTIKMKDLVKIGKKSTSKQNKTKRKNKNSLVFSDVSFNDISLKNSMKRQTNLHYDKINQLATQIRAAITIQRHFRGYITRKYIYQLKQMTFSAIKIQKVFRGYLSRKKTKSMHKFIEYPISVNNRKNLSISNSLITIKDFNSDQKDQKQKTFKFFNFDEDISLSHKKIDKQIAEQLEKVHPQNSHNDCDQEGFKRQNNEKTGENIRQNKKYIEILQDLLLEQGLQEQLKDRIRSTLKASEQLQSGQKVQQRQNYVKNKINSEINSQKSFNSPRSLCSPKNNIFFTSPNSNKSKSISKIQVLEGCSSPRIDQAEKVNQRIASPCKQITNSHSNKKIVFLTEKKQVRPFDTTFEFIQEFQLIIVDFLRDNNEMKEQFLNRVKDCEHFKTNLILKEWDHFQECSEMIVPRFAFSEEYCQPVIFDDRMKNMILDEPAMKIHLQEKNYLQSLWSCNQQQKQVYEGYINLIFDGLTQAIYRNYRSEILTKSTKFYGTLYQGHDLFKFILMNSLTYLQGWCQYLGGMQIPVESQDPSYGLYTQKNNQRMDELVNSELKPFTQNDENSWTMWISIMIGEIIFQQVAEEINSININKF